jgi:hypothetical protein
MVGLSLTTAALMMSADNPSDLESMFMEEIKRRGLDSVDMADIGRDSSGEELGSTAGSSTTTSAVLAATEMVQQLKRQMNCITGLHNSEFTSQQLYAVLRCDAGSQHPSTLVLSTLERPTFARMHSGPSSSAQLSRQCARTVPSSHDLRM